MEKIYQRLYVDELLIPKDSEVISITAIIKTKEGQHQEEIEEREREKHRKLFRRMMNR